MKVLFAASEALPFVKTGGLADVAAALPKELAKQGVEVCVVLPMYGSIKRAMPEDMHYIGNCIVPLAWRNLYCGVFSCEHDNVTYYFLDNEFYFNRGACYGQTDDGERFAFFTKAVLESMSLTGFYPDVIHANDWQTALIPLFLKAHYSHLPEYAHIKTVFTIHNIEYQGWCAHTFLSDVCGAGREYDAAMELGNAINMLKGAVVLSDAVTTVSETYAKELQYAFYGHGLENVISMYNYKLSGITNGIDPAAFDPATDKLIYKNYTPNNLAGKLANKRKLQAELGLYENDDSIVISMITRLVDHKGLDLIEFVFDEMMQANIQFVLLGTGDFEFEEAFRIMARRYPKRVSVNIMFDNTLAHKIYAGSDLFLMPSKAEPCGLSQLISMRYGTLPIVRDTGGLADTVKPITCERGDGRGFNFRTYNAHDMLQAIWAAVGLYASKAQWNKVVTTCMHYDSSWTIPAGKYKALYENLKK